MRYIFNFILITVLIVVVGGIALDSFPQIQPLYEELKSHIINLYNISLVKYGSTVTILIIVAIFVLVGSSKRV